VLVFKDLGPQVLVKDSPPAIRDVNVSCKIAFVRLAC